MSTLTCHLVTRDPAAAASWYGSVLGAVEISRITLPGGQTLSVELRFGDSTLSIADEFPDMGIVSPLTLGGTYGALHLAVEDADAVWKRALGAGATVFEPLHEGSAPDDGFLERYGNAFARLERLEPDALALFDQLTQEAPDDPCVALHVERLRRGDLGTTVVMTEK